MTARGSRYSKEEYAQRGTGQEHKITGVIDTGFDGFLTLPFAIIAALRCPYVSQGYVMLADGRMEATDIYETIVEWDGQHITVETDAADTTPLIGMALMHGYELNVQNVAGGVVTLRKM